MEKNLKLPLLRSISKTRGSNYGNIVLTAVLHVNLELLWRLSIRIHAQYYNKTILWIVVKVVFPILMQYYRNFALFSVTSYTTTFKIQNTSPIKLSAVCTMARFIKWSQIMTSSIKFNRSIFAFFEQAKNIRSAKLSLFKWPCSKWLPLALSLSDENFGI